MREPRVTQVAGDTVRTGARRLRAAERSGGTRQRSGARPSVARVARVRHGAATCHAAHWERGAVRHRHRARVRCEHKINMRLQFSKPVV